MTILRKPNNLPALNLLGISFAYPPLAYPRSIQVARLFKYLDASVVVVCGDELGTTKDSTIAPEADTYVRECLRIPFTISAPQRILNQITSRFHKSTWNYQNMAPDKYRQWKTVALRAIHGLMFTGSYIPDVLVTFGQPFTDHLIGLELKSHFNFPWVAHFSDPWVDNPFNIYDRRTRELNLELERSVIESADVLAFTSQETVEVMFAKYPERLKEKARLVPQSFDSSLFEGTTSKLNSRLILRHLGNFYGHRTPFPLLKVLRKILDTEPELLRDLTIELIGLVDSDIVRESTSYALPETLLSFLPSVSYRESLELMKNADGLLVIDAPADVSVFLPSKLIDYVGADRPVLGLTSPGTASTLIRELGGFAADPSDVDAMRIAFQNFVSLLANRRSIPSNELWGNPEVRARFEGSRVADDFRVILDEVSQIRRAKVSL